MVVAMVVVKMTLAVLVVGSVGSGGTVGPVARTDGGK